MKKAALHNLGCKVNAYEMEAMQQMLEEAGYQIVPFQERADVYVINTCSVTNIADRKSRQMLHRARRRNPNAVIVAAGCYVQTAGQDIIMEGIADIVLGNNKKKNLISVLDAWYGCRMDAAKVNNSHTICDWEDCNDGCKEYEHLSMTRPAGHTRAFVKVQDGCNQFCSYCIIPYARGRVRSRKPQDVLAEIRALAAGGCQEVVLTGIHLSSYGLDEDPAQRTDLAALLAQVHEVDAIRRIRLGSLEPGIVTEEFAAALAGMPKVCPHFHLSLQSGSDSVLKRMNRRYTADAYALHCEILRRYFLDPAITTDVIVGFPGETEEEFEETVRFARRMRFSEMHIFKYSKRKGTKAAKMDGQIPESVKARRSAKLAAAAEEMARDYRERLVGAERTVLLEEPFVLDGKQYYTGFTEEYVKVAVESSYERTNSLAHGKIMGHLAGELYILVEF
ncbi:MAG: tRNA (N(6)-L-threonylcarbamoyladenosine(37)-C(2))-methylthiotransferase MtaB [Eubacterium sp.]|nr:tRNA (N(6)-L-threonylcarbamoyladenosine(37)-C(2))-methylthiotransferase MtaB [Eubacterium sp.]